jgi:ketosteroid isomerase-like protein
MCGGAFAWAVHSAPNRATNWGTRKSILEAITNMSEQNAELVTKTWKDVVAGNADAALANMSDEISWVIPGNLQGVSGLKRGKAAVKEFIGGIRKAFPAGLNSQISKVHSAGDTVIVELTNTGKAFNGRDYRNEYCFVFEVEGGKIRRIREYVDMLTVKEALM